LLHVYHSELIGWKDLTQNDLLCVEWYVKLCSLSHSLTGMVVHWPLTSLVHC